MRVTRGFGILEQYLASLRVKKANQLVKGFQFKEKLLDIGCGSYPLFIMNTDYRERYGLDGNVHDMSCLLEDETLVSLKRFNIAEEQALPFNDSTFDAVSMLAVLEHVYINKASFLFSEIFRVLKPGGSYILTTPAPWTGGLLTLMAYMRLISPDECDDHKDLYGHDQIRTLMVSAGFNKDNIRCGYFECFMNLWAVARK